ncbi:MAG TPA: ACP S-malonyltransferase [Firmicutes bacterium]|nr:ACP S-malonyltransferase [Bacillota bacterium]
MGRIAFLFSGQGDQYPGMGKALADSYPAAASVYRMCDGIRPGTSSQCFEGTEEELKETKNTQPCLFAIELAAAAVLMEKGIRPDAVAGFSLGEVTAATAAGIFDRETGFRLVCRRGELMQQEAEKFDTAMAAVVKLTPEQVQEVCSRYPEVYPVNFNCPGQITVSGLASQMPAFFAEVKAAGGKAIPLKVKGAFHSPFMKEAASAFSEELAKSDIRRGTIPLYSNMTAEPYTEDIAGLLSQQICSPVQWEKLIRGMIASGMETFVEIGPGRTLTNMMKKIDPAVKALTVTEFLAEVEAC